MPGHHHHLAQAPSPDILAKKASTLRDHDEENAASDDDDIDETFVALEKLLHALNGQANNSNFGNNSSTRVAPSSSRSTAARITREEMLEARRRERERCRAMLFHRRSSQHLHNSMVVDSSCDDESERETEREHEHDRIVSVESAISTRVISGSFSAADARRLNRVHAVMARDRRWREQVEDRERLPVVLLPKNGQFVPPTANPKLNVVLTQEHEMFREQWLEWVTQETDEEVETNHLLTPPLTTWYIQMRDLDAVQARE